MLAFGKVFMHQVVRPTEIWIDFEAVSRLGEEIHAHQVIRQEANSVLVEPSSERRTTAAPLLSPL